MYKRFYVSEGNYLSGSDSRVGRWYVMDRVRAIDKRGNGTTKKEAMAKARRLNAEYRGGSR